MRTGYDDILEHLAMLRDEVRTGAFQRALRATVRPGDVVLDFGCGTGVLSIFAARAGAKQVYAIDRSVMLRAAERLAAGNGEDGIRFFLADADDVNLPGPVDVLVSEWMGHFVFAESMLGPLVRLRERYLSVDGRMVPARVSLHAALVRSSRPFAARSFLREPRYGIDFSVVADWPLRQPSPARLCGSDLWPEQMQLAVLDMKTCGECPPAMRGSIVPTQAGSAYGLCGWFDVELAPGIGFSTGPFSPETHWLQMYFPLPEPVDMRAGVPVEVQVEPLALGGAPAWRWSVATGGRVAEVEDVVHRAWLSRGA